VSYTFHDEEESLQAWEAWVKEPVPMRLIVKYLPAVYGTKKLPEGIQTAEDVEQHACEYARQHQLNVRLAVSRRLSVWINQEGEVVTRTEATPDHPKVPFMRLKGSQRRLYWRFEGGEGQRAE
jgi:hypothetical protein